jgi:hypothetical protein
VTVTRLAAVAITWVDRGGDLGLLHVLFLLISCYPSSNARTRLYEL